MIALSGTHADAQPERVESTRIAMGSAFRIIVEVGGDETTPDPEHADLDAGRALARHAITEALDRIDALEEALSDYRPRSEAMRLVTAPAGQPVEISQDLALALALADAMHRETGGAFDVTVGPVTHLWREAWKTGAAPDAHLLDAARDAVGMQLVKLDPASNRVTLQRSGMILDFGGIGKGLAADLAGFTLRGHGFTRFLIDAGGDLLAGDPPLGKDGWRVRVGATERGWTRVIELANAAVATSGDIYRFVEIDGVRYSHIIDPRTGTPVTTPRIVSVVAPNGAVSDALASAVSVLGPEQGLAMLAPIANVEGAVVEAGADGTPVVSMSDNFPPEAPRLPGYSIPILDLAHDTARQTVVDREPGQYLGHPSTVLLDDGRTIVAVYPKGHGRGAIVMKRSDDGGRTWSERLPTPENWATSLETPTIHLVDDPDAGRRRLLLFSGLCPIRTASSDDLGRTWTELQPIGDYGGIVAMGSLYQRPDGTLLAWFHDDGRFIRKGGERTGVFTLYQIESPDAGRHWSEPRPLWSGSEIHLCEPGLVVSPDGETLALLLRESARKRNSHVIFSHDQGRTWTDPAELPAALTGDRHTAVYAPDGRLFISFRDTTRVSQTQGDWVAWVGTWEDIAQRRDGQYRVRLMDNRHKWDCAYPGVVVLPDGTIVTTTYGHWIEGEEPYIVSVRLTLDELDRLAEEEHHGE